MAKCTYPPYWRQPNPFPRSDIRHNDFVQAEIKREQKYNREEQAKCDKIDAAEKAAADKAENERKEREERNRPKPVPVAPVGGRPSPASPAPASPRPSTPGEIPGSEGDDRGDTASGNPCPPGYSPNYYDRHGKFVGTKLTPAAHIPFTGCAPEVPAKPPEPGDKDDCCERTGAGLQSIAAALAEINATLNAKLGKAKDTEDATIDEIIEKLRERFETGILSCDACKEMVKNGLGGTLEYAVACAGACLEKAEVECSMGDPDSWGKPCDTCGEPCCKCDKGICKPEPCPEEKPKQKYIAWCSPATGSIAVTKEGASPPGAGFFRVGMAESEEAAAEIATANCKKADSPTSPLPGGEVSPPITGPPTFCDFDSFIRYMGAQNVARHQSAVNAGAGIAQATNAVLKFGFEGVNPGVLGEVVQGAFRATTGAPGYFMQHLMPTAIAALGCDNEVFKSSVQMLAGIDAISKLAGADVTQWTDQIRYVANANCRMQFMTPDQAMAAYLANNIDYNKLDGHWAIANICRESLDSTVQASKAKPVPIQLAMMRRRKMIDAGGYANGMRRLGYLESSTAEQLFQLTEQVPTMSDLIRLMVRDAGDESIPSWPESDKIFAQKFGGKLQEWAEFQGLTPDMMKYIFRAHWSIPAPGQLFRFNQRLRDNPKFGGRAKVLADVKNALIQQDILPFWHEHFLETSFLPIGRIDIRRAFNMGSMKDEELVPAYGQLGYSDEDSERLAKFSRRLRAESAVSHRAVKLWLKFAISRTEARQRMVDGGLPDDIVDAALSDAEISFASSVPAAAFVRGDLTRQQFTDRIETVGVTSQTATKIADILALKITDHPATKGYAAGVVDYETAKSEMVNFGMAEQVVSNLLDGITKTIDYSFAVACQKGIKGRYLDGEFDNQQAQTELLNRGTSLERANRLIENWGCERDAAGKAVATNRLCDWLANGTISGIEFATRLVRLGHTEVDSARIRDDCLASISVKRQKQADKEAKDQSALEQREASALRRATAAAQREQSAIQRQNEQRAKTNANRQKQFLSAAVKVSNKCDCDLYDSQANVKAQAARVQREYGLTIDESLQLVIKAAEAWDGGDVGSYAEVVTTLALGLNEPAEV